MQRKPVNPWDWSLQFGFNQAELIEGQRRLLVCSGQTAVDDQGAPQHAGDMAAQIALALDNGAHIEGILITHGHIDHIGGLNEAIAATGAPVWLHPDDIWLYEQPMFGMPAVGVPANATHLNDEDEISLAGMRFRVLHT